jgi:5-enolpyruvylshikimate-3-phosphate synthase
MKAYVRPTRGLSGHLDPPSSKNYTTRYLLVAALAEGESIVRFPAHSDDATAMRRCLAAFGAHIEDGNDERGPFVRVRGFAGVPENPGTVNPGNAGAVLRLLLGVGAQLGQVRFETDFADSLGKRPHGDLLRALGDLGVERFRAARWARLDQRCQELAVLEFAALYGAFSGRRYRGGSARWISLAAARAHDVGGNAPGWYRD